MAVSGEIMKPDFERAIRVIKGDVESNTESRKEAGQNVTAAWNIVEKECHVNKTAARDFRKISNMADEVRDDYLRSLYGLLQADGLGIRPDLIDVASGDGAPDMPVATAKTATLATLN